MWLKKSSMVLIFALLALSAAGQQAVTLEDLVARAMQENYQVRIIRNQEQMARNQNTLGNAGFMPSLGVRADRVWGIQNTEQRFFSGETRSGSNARNDRLDAFVELDWMVFDGFRMFANRNRLNALEQMGIADTRFYVEQTMADMAELYYQLIMELQMLESLRKSFRISDFRLRLESQKRNVGTGNALLYHQALIDFNSDSALIVNQQRVIRDLQIQMNYLVGQPARTEIVPALDVFQLQGLDDEQVLLDAALQNSSQLERARLEELITESSARMERAARYPQISLFGNYSYTSQNNEVGFIETSTMYGGQYGIRVRFNLFDGGRVNTAVRNAALARENAMIAADDARAALESQLAALLNAYEAYLTQYRLLEQSLQASGTSLEIAREQLQEGFINGFDFRQTQLASLRVENQLTALRYSLKATEIQIFRLSGMLTQLVMSN
jgi:outer membrane protein